MAVVLLEVFISLAVFLATTAFHYAFFSSCLAFGFVFVAFTAVSRRNDGEHARQARLCSPWSVALPTYIIVYLFSSVLLFNDVLHDVGVLLLFGRRHFRWVDVCIRSRVGRGVRFRLFLFGHPSYPVY